MKSLAFLAHGVLAQPPSRAHHAFRFALPLPIKIGCLATAMAVIDLAEELLYEEEGPTLDFKQQQYPFDGATAVEKSELLKDILAFANAWRRTDAFVFIGAQEVKGARSKVVGIAQHIDDAILQQFVNSKTNRPVEFSYRAFELEGKQLALIKIPVQQRPTYLLKDYGNLSKHTVYLRRGSSTAIATPEEIAKMGAAAMALQTTPSLTACLVTGPHEEVMAPSAKLAVINAQIPDKSEFPSYGTQRIGGALSVILPSPMKNAAFYSEYAEWWKKMRRFNTVKLCVENKGDGVATDVKLVLDIKKPAADVEICRLADLPTRPSPSTLNVSSLHIRDPLYQPDVTIQQTSEGWRICGFFGKIQAKDRFITHDQVVMGASKNVKIGMIGNIYADELAAPIPQNLSVEMEVSDRSYSVDDLLTRADAKNDRDN